jgi:CubicO group peptidase (beta-lactamase class C family)
VRQSCQSTLAAGQLALPAPQDREANLFARYDNKWRLASVSKPVTSAAIFKLIEAGKLSLGSKVRGWAAGA